MDQIIDSYFRRYYIPDHGRVIIGRAEGCHIQIDHPAMDEVHLAYDPSCRKLTVLSGRGAAVTYRVSDAAAGDADRWEFIFPTGRDYVLLPKMSLDEMFFVHIGDERENIVLTFQEEYVPGMEKPRIPISPAQKECCPSEAR